MNTLIDTNTLLFCESKIEKENASGAGFEVFGLSWVNGDYQLKFGNFVAVFGNRMLSLFPPQTWHTLFHSSSKSIIVLLFFLLKLFFQVSFFVERLNFMNWIKSKKANISKEIEVAAKKIWIRSCEIVWNGNNRVLSTEYSIDPGFKEIWNSGVWIKQNPCLKIY